MAKVLFLITLFLSATGWSKSTPVTYNELRPRLLLQAKADLYEVEAYPEIAMPPKGSAVDLSFTEYNQPKIRKGHFYRISYLRSYDVYGLKDSKKVDTVYSLSLIELGQSLQPTGVKFDVGAKADPETVVGNFIQIPDQLSSSPTLQTGRAQVGDHIVNSSAVRLGGLQVAAYNKFEVVSIRKEYIPFTLAYNYILSLREVRSKKMYELKAPGLQKLPVWALVVAPGNERVIKFPGGELHY
ncbi:hypothetical protein [Bdellovibrio bacteriovorus]|uniref:hypothetical protein n=1 Tax=Bdellovibrio bacteriovorus TaxID=959 RepID=UPI0035A66F53